MRVDASAVDLDVTVGGRRGRRARPSSSRRAWAGRRCTGRAPSPTARWPATTTRSARSRGACASSPRRSSCGASRASARRTSTPRPARTPPCDLPVDDKRRVELSLGHLHVAAPDGRRRRSPPSTGTCACARPSALAERAASLPETDGWVGLDADVRYGHGHDPAGPHRARSRRTTSASRSTRFAQELHSQLTIRRNVIESPVTTLRLGERPRHADRHGGRPAGQGRAAREDAARRRERRLHGAPPRPRRAPALVRRLGHPRAAHAVISGTFVPLKLDGEFTAKTYTFGVYDRPAEDKARERVFGVPEAQIAAHVAIRPDALKFIDVHATLPRSHVDGGLVSIGFHNDLRVDAPHVTADLDDLSPIGPVVMHGKLEASGRVTGTFNHPEPGGRHPVAHGLRGRRTCSSATSRGPREGRRPRRRRSRSRASTRSAARARTRCRPRRSGSAGRTASWSTRWARAAGFGLRDLLSMFALDDDPRYDGLDAQDRDARGRARRARRPRGHVRLGLHRRRRARATWRTSSIYGERFAQGDADVSMRWYDRQAGIAGADVDLRSFVLDKVQPPAGHAGRRDGHHPRLGLDPSRRRGLRERDDRGRAALARRRAGLYWPARSRGASRASRTSPATSTTSAPTPGSMRAPSSTWPARAVRDVALRPRTCRCA